MQSEKSYGVGRVENKNAQQTMNDELKIAELKSDKKRIEYEVSKHITDSLNYFKDKYGIDADIEIDTTKSHASDGYVFDTRVRTKLIFNL